MLRIHLSSFDLEGLQESFTVAPGAILIKQTACYLSLDHDVWMKEYYLIPKISSDHFFEHPNMGQIASFIEDDLHFSLWEGCVINHLQWGVAAEHLKVEIFPLFADPHEYRLAFLHGQILESNLKDGVIQTAPIKQGK